MPGYEIARQHFLCYTVRREYVAGHNKLLLIHGVLGSDTPGSAHQRIRDKARIYPKGHK
jgi:hypothetical protein